MRTLLRCALVLGCLVGFVSRSTDVWAIPITVGPGVGFTNGGVDGGTPTNLDRNVTAPLTPADDYQVTNFNVQVSGSNGTNAVVPFLAVGSPSTYTVLWVGDPFIPLIDGVHNLTFNPGDELFTLNTAGTIFGAVDSNGGPLVLFSNGGVTDHDGSPGFGTINVNDVLTGFSNPGLGRTYSFSIVFEQVPPVPEPSTLALLGLGVFGLAIKARRRRRTVA